MSEAHHFKVQVYYEDTDHSGVVYHPNYLKFMERAREHWLGIDVLLRLAREEGIGFAVYKADLTYNEGAQFGDELEVRTTATCEGEYRLVMRQDVLRAGSKKVLVAGKLTLVCVDAGRKLAPLPLFVYDIVGEPPPESDS